MKCEDVNTHTHWWVVVVYAYIYVYTLHYQAKNWRIRTVYEWAYKHWNLILFLFSKTRRSIGSLFSNSIPLWSAASLVVQSLRCVTGHLPWWCGWPSELVLGPDSLKLSFFTHETELPSSKQKGQAVGPSDLYLCFCPSFHLTPE